MNKRITTYVLLSIAYVVFGKLGLMLALPPGYASPIFPSSGIALAAVFIWGRWTLPWIFLGSLLLNAWVGFSESQSFNSASLYISIAIAVASTLQAAAGSWLLRRIVGYPASLDHGGEVFRFIFLAPAICLVSATFSVSSLFAFGITDVGGFMKSWVLWWAGDTLGVLTMFPVVMIIAGEPRTLWRSRMYTVALPMLLVFALFVTLFFKVNQWERNDTLTEFRQLSLDAANQVQSKLDEQSFLLEQMRGLFIHDAKDTVTKNEFHRFVRQSLTRFSMIQALEWAPEVDRAQRAQFEATQRKDAPDFEIRERNSIGEMQRASERESYYPVTYIEPLAGNEPAMGFDLASNAARMAALDKAHQSGTVVISSPIKLVQEHDQQAGVLLMLSVTRHDKKSAVVLTVLRMGDFMDKLLLDSRPMLYTRLIDLNERKAIFDNFVTATQPALYEHAFTFGTRHYRLETSPTPAYLNRHQSWQSWGVLAVGTLGTGLIGALLLIGTGYAARIEVEVKNRTRELDASKKSLVEAQSLAKLGSWHVVFGDDESEDKWTISEELRKLWGHSNTTEISTRGGFAKMPPEDQELTQRYWAAAKQGNGPNEWDHRILVNGETRWMHVVANFTFDANGKPLEARGTNQDITERKEYEKKILGNEQNLLEILNNSPIAVRIATNMGRKVVFCNQGYTRLIKNINAIGDDPKTYYAREREYEEIVKEVLLGKTILNRQIELKIPDGETIWVLASYMPLQYHGETGVLGWFFDITDSKQAEDQFRAAVEAAPNGMLVVNERGVITLVNSQINSIFGYSGQELVGYSIHTLLPQNLKAAHAAHVSGFFANPAMRKMGEGRDLFGQHKDGRQIQVEIGLSPIRIQGENHVLASIVDITERQETLTRLRSTSNELERANALIEEERSKLAERVMERTAQLQLASQAKDSFLATMSHEIRTPLGGMLGMMDLLSLSSLGPEQRLQLETAQLSGKNLLRIVNDILDWSKIEAGKLELSLRNASVPEVLNGVANTYSQLASKNGIHLKVEIDSELGAAHIFDPLRLAQILNNFTSNAIKFTPQGEVTLSAQRVASHKGFETVRFSVKDSGAGIDAEHQVRLFKHYEQATADTARLYGGTGLGLAICRRLAELMDGTIGMESTAGAGSTFSLTVSLPVAEGLSQPPRKIDQQTSNADTAPLIKGTAPVVILIVDDHPVNRMLLKQQLELLGLQVQAAEDGARAFVLWQSSHFDLIITDCHMPEMDGYELSRRIRSLEEQAAGKRIPIIAWTANVLADEATKTRAAGMDDLLTKPTEISELRVKLLKWLPKTMMSSAADSSPRSLNITTTETAFDPGVLNTLVASRAAQFEMLKMFIDQNHIDIAALKTTLEGDDPAAVAGAAHRIKGASRMMGAKELEVLSIRIEQAAKQQDMQGARGAAQVLDETAARLEAAVRQFVSEQ